MSDHGLPENGEVRLGPVTLPKGRRLATVGGQAVAWVTESRIPDAGRSWWMLSDLHADTGLVPFLAAYGTGEFPVLESHDLAELEHMSAERELLALWPASYHADDRDEELDEDAAERAPFGRMFPGLAPGEETRLSLERLRAAVDSLTGAEDSLPGRLCRPGLRIGLAVASRPADVLPVIGWMATDADYISTLDMAVVLRSWEDRFGARLIQIGPGATIKLLVERPPRTFEAAQALAAEHYAFAQESQSVAHSVREIARALVGAPIWRLWWD